MKSLVWGRQIAKDGRWIVKSASQLFIIVTILITLIVGVVLGLFGPYVWAAVIVSMIMALLIILRQDEVATALIVAIHLNVDWYVGFRVISLVMVLALLYAFYIDQSSLHPW